MCPFRSKFSHLPRTLNLALPVLLLLLVPSYQLPFFSLICWSLAVSPSLGSFPPDLSPLCSHTCLCRSNRQGCQEHKAQHPGSSHSLRLQQLGGHAFRTELLTLDAPQCEWIFFSNRVKQSCEAIFFFSTDTF